MTILTLLLNLHNCHHSRIKSMHWTTKGFTEISSGEITENKISPIPTNLVDFCTIINFVECRDHQEIFGFKLVTSRSSNDEPVKQSITSKWQKHRELLTSCDHQNKTCWLHDQYTDRTDEKMIFQTNSPIRTHSYVLIHHMSVDK